MMMRPIEPAEFTRNHMLSRINSRQNPWDLIVIGGGATGIAIAMDAASRGLEVVLLEQSDFGKGTSSRSTKLVHGGVRYLKQGNVTLVRDALRERTLLRENAPHLVHDLPFLIPCSGWWDRFFYGIGLKVYGFLAGRHRFGSSHGLSAKRTIARIPELKSEMAKGGVVYHDGQFDDSRLLIAMARTAAEQGACLVNYVPVTGLIKNSSGAVAGVTMRDQESGSSRELLGRCVINAAGPFCDAVRSMDNANSEPMLNVSQGVHLVLPRKFLAGDTAIMVPKTSDGRVIFMIPWHDQVIVGTTDTPIERAVLEPTPQPAEIQFLLDTAAQYLSSAPKLSDVLSCYTGIRPLVRDDKSARTASLSRDHVIKVSDSKLITITGGKWTTVRKMAEDCVNRAYKVASIEFKPCVTKSLRLHGFKENSTGPRSYYGSDLEAVKELERNQPELAVKLHPGLELYLSDVVWAVRHEMARTIDDVLARRNRALFLNAAATGEVAERVAGTIAQELNFDNDWVSGQVKSFRKIVACYLVEFNQPST